jgi:hypothetical protein
MEQVHPPQSDARPARPAPAGGRPLSPSRALAAVVAIAAGAAASLARQDGAGALRTIWAEDGRVFLTDALRHGGLEMLLAPYNGYAHLVPRLLAAMTAALPLHDASVVLAVASALVVGTCAWCVWYATAAWIRRPVLRGAVATLVVLVPAGQTETLNNAANLHWYLLFASAWVFVWRPPSAPARALALGIVFAAAASDPLVVLLAPMALIGWRHDRGAVIPPLVATALGLVLQALSPLVGTSDRAFATRASPWLVAPWYGERVVSRLVFPARWVGGAGFTRVMVAGIAVSAVAAVLLLLLRGAPSDRRALPVALAVTSVLTFGVPTFLTGVAAARYEILPVLLLAAALAVLTDVALDPPRRIRRPAVAAALLWLAVVAAVEFRVPTPRGSGPTWDEGLSRAEASCGAGAARARAPITPREGTWFVVVPCARLDGGGAP